MAQYGFGFTQTMIGVPPFIGGAFLSRFEGDVSGLFLIARGDRSR